LEFNGHTDAALREEFAVSQTKPQKTVFGVDAPPPKLTRAGILRLGLYVGLPVFGLLLLLDIAGFLIAKYGFGTCYGILCAFA